MDDDLGAVTERLTSARTRQGLVNAFTRELARYGVRGLGYAFTAFSDDPSLPVSERFIFVHSYGDDWDVMFGGAAALDDDGSVDTVRSATGLVFWHDAAIFAQLPPRQRAYAIAERDFGLVHGVTMDLSLGPQRRLKSAVGLWFSTAPSDADFEAHWRAVEGPVRARCEIFDGLALGSQTSVLIGLSDRERDTLGLAAAGFTNDGIAARMAITPKTVEKHLAAARRKLMVGTRAGAVARALALGLIEP